MDFSSQAELNVPKEWNQRKYSRTVTGAGTIVEMEFKDDSNYRMTGLVYDGSHGGCGIVAVTDVAVSVNQMCKMTMGGVGPINARVRWVKELESSVIRFGVEYLG